MSKTLPHFDDDHDETMSFEPIATVEQHTTATIKEEEPQQPPQQQQQQVLGEENDPSSFPFSPDISGLPSKSNSFNEHIQLLLGLEDEALAVQTVHGAIQGTAGDPILALATIAAGTVAVPSSSPGMTRELGN